VNAPSAPNPVTTAQAQTASNENTADYQQNLNQTNQITPYGSINYAQTGTAADGAPISTATTTLSQPVQNLVDSDIANSQGMSNLDAGLQARAGSAITAGAPTAPQLQNLNLSEGALDNSINQANEATLNPQWAQLGQQNSQNAYDQGLAPGSQGYTNNMNAFSNARDNAYNSMYVADQGQAANDLTAENASVNNNAQMGFGDTLTSYNNALNSLSALQSGSQISQPGVGQTANAPQTSVAGTNVAGIDQSSYQDQMQQYSQMMGGIFGLAGTGAQAAMML
jgi:hypothetical protein